MTITDNRAASPAPKNPAVADIDAREQADSRISLSRKECMTEGNWGQTTQITKEASGCFNRYLDGSSVRITTRSFYEHLRALVSAPPRKARQPKTRFQKRRREPTPAELEGLKRGNAKRAAEARQRKEAARARV